MKSNVNLPETSRRLRSSGFLVEDLGSPRMKRQMRTILKASAQEALGNEAATVPVEHYTRKEIAVLAKICVHTVARDVRAGRLKEIRHNRRRLRYHPDAVKEYLAGFYGVSISDKPCLTMASQKGPQPKPHMERNEVHNAPDFVDSSKVGDDNAPNPAVSGTKNVDFPNKSVEKPAGGASRPYNEKLNRSGQMLVFPRFSDPADANLTPLTSLETQAILTTLWAKFSGRSRQHRRYTFTQHTLN
jgi:hypothetical protein